MIKITSPTWSKGQALEYQKVPIFKPYYSRFSRSSPPIEGLVTTLPGRTLHFAFHRVPRKGPDYMLSEQVFHARDWTFKRSNGMIVG